MLIKTKKIDNKTAEQLDVKDLSIKSLLGHFFLEQNTFASFISGALTAATICLIIFNGTFMPFIVWVGIMIIHAVIKATYWLVQVKLADQEIGRLDKELAQLTNEIQKKQVYFEGLKKKKGLG